MKKCVIETCVRRAHYKDSQLCKTCYAGLYYWKGASPTRLLKRQKQLMVLQARMSTLTSTRVLRRRKAA